MTKDEILNLEMPHAAAGPDDGEVLTIRRYLCSLLQTLIREEESFSGKRPLGDSGWLYDFELTFIQHDLVQGKFEEYEEDGTTYVDAYGDDINETQKLLVDLIGFLFYYGPDDE